MSELSQADYAPLALAVVEYERERSEGRHGSSEFNAAMKLLKDFPPDRQPHWRVQLTTIRERYGS